MNLRTLRLALSNTLLGLIYLFCAVYFLRWFFVLEGPARIPQFLFFVQMLLIMILVFSREAPQRISYGLSDWVFSLLGSWLPFFLTATNFGKPLLLGIALQVIGILFSFWGLISLGNSFGIVPARRAIKVKGIYSKVRHPLYLCYEISILGYLVNQCNFYNLCLAAAWTLCQVMRIFAEERMLSKESNYADYMKQVPWRMIPHLF